MRFYLLMVVFFLLIIVILIIGMVPLAAIKKGDANLDGEVTLTDLVVVKAHMLGIAKLPPFGRYAADVNRDGKIDQTDYDTLLDLLEH